MAGDTKRRWFRRRPPADAGPVPRADAAATQAGPAVSDRDVAGGSPEVLAAVEDTAAILARLADYVRVQVRSGVYDVADLRDMTLQAAASETDDPDYADELARQVLSAELIAWHEDAADWLGRTDPERLDAALARLESTGVLVLPGLAGPEALQESLRVRGGSRGTVAYLISDVWHALDNDALPLRVLEDDGSPAGRRSELLAATVDALAADGLLAAVPQHPPVPGAVLLVGLSWRRRPPG